MTKRDRRCARNRFADKNESARFKSWLVERGAELLTTTNEWEVVRFRGDGITSIVYTTQKETLTFTGRAESAWDAFLDHSPGFRFGKELRTAGVSERTYRHSVTIRTLIERDGDVCFYDGEPLADSGPRRRTREHLVARTHSGTDHISNLFLSCPGCNGKAGHLSAPEKIRMRDRIRRGRGSMLLERVAAEFVCNGVENDVVTELRAAIANFLHETNPKETTECQTTSTDATPSTNCSPR